MEIANVIWLPKSPKPNTANRPTVLLSANTRARTSRRRTARNARNSAPAHSMRIAVTNVGSAPCASTYCDDAPENPHRAAPASVRAAPRREAAPAIYPITSLKNSATGPSRLSPSSSLKWRTGSESLRDESR